MRLLLLFVFVVFQSFNFFFAYAEEAETDFVAVQRIKRQTEEEMGNKVSELRRDLNVYTFTSVDYPAIFAIIAGISTILAIAILFIAVGIWNMDPGKDSIIYRMTTTRLKKD